MAFDAFFLSAVLDEIRAKATGARVEKIHQPGRDSVLLLLRCEGGREKLLFAPNPAAPRLHFTAASPENPPEPPMFCMLLRKHLSGARLSHITQPEMERCAVLAWMKPASGLRCPAFCTKSRSRWPRYPLWRQILPRSWHLTALTFFAIGSWICWAAFRPWSAGKRCSLLPEMPMPEWTRCLPMLRKS